MATLVLGINGAAGSGKSEVAKHLEKAHGFTTVKFAGPLKAMLRAFYLEVGLDEATIERKIEGDLKEEPCPYLCGRSPRYAMVTLGTEWGRDQMDQSFWINAWGKSIDSVDGPVVTDDVRFDNEAQAILASSGIVLKVIPNKLRRQKSDHVSEQGISPQFLIGQIRNSGTLKLLRRRVDNVLKKLNWIDPSS